MLLLWLLLLTMINIINSSSFFNNFFGPKKVNGELCKRECNNQPLECVFYFHLETSWTMSKACFECPSVITDCSREDCMVGGGVEREVTVVNRKLPSPPIEVCQGDKITVLVENDLDSGESTTMHWHGLHQQRAPYMDGVPYVTQCPILYNNNFTYTFYADEAGTHWYHSHSLIQRGDGINGAFIVRKPKQQECHKNLYDIDDHTMIITDWNDEKRMKVFQRYVKDGGQLDPTGILINGLGPQVHSNIIISPVADFRVRQNKLYRFRIINANFFDCPWELTVQGHKLLVIGTDGEDIEPREVDSIMSNSGERFDVVIKTNQPVGQYLILLKGYLTCEIRGIYQVATLTYEESGMKPLTSIPETINYDTAADVGNLVLNPYSKKLPMGMTSENRKFVALDDLRSVEKFSLRKPDVTFYLSLDMSRVDHPANQRRGFYGFNDVPENMQTITPQINHISYRHTSQPLLANRDLYKSSDFCNVNTMKSEKCEENYCKCTHVLSVRRNSVVEIVLFEEADQTHALAVHPIHLHGYKFYVVHMSELSTNFTRNYILKNDQDFRRNLKNPPLKDTVTVLRSGVTIIQFHATNPGYWFMHCHVDVHSLEGMDLVVKVGENYEMAIEPHGFPKCHNYPK